MLFNKIDNIYIKQNNDNNDFFDNISTQSSINESHNNIFISNMKKNVDLLMENIKSCNNIKNHYKELLQYEQERNDFLFENYELYKTRYKQLINNNNNKELFVKSFFYQEYQQLKKDYFILLNKNKILLEKQNKKKFKD